MQERYARQIPLPEIGEAGQEMLACATVTVIGCGGLGSPALTYLACAGVGTLRLIDSDTVSLSNLNRQFLHEEAWIGRSKADSAADRLRAMNSSITVQPISVRLTDENADTLLAGSDVVVDCVDNLETRRLVGRACLRRDIPLVEGGVTGFQGFVLCIDRRSPCLECMGQLPAPAETPAVLGVTAGVIGTLQASECIKLLLGRSERLHGQMLFVDLLTLQMEKIPLALHPHCSAHFP